MKLAKRLLQLLEGNDFELVLDQLSNNEFDSDKVLLAFLIKNTKLDKKSLEKLIKKERSNFLKISVVKNGEKIIKSFFNDED